MKHVKVKMGGRMGRQRTALTHTKEKKSMPDEYKTLWL